MVILREQVGFNRNSLMAHFTIKQYWKWKWSHSVMSDSLPTRLLRPWGFPGNSTGVGCHFLFQGIFPTQGSNPGLLHCRQTLCHLSHQGSQSSMSYQINRLTEKHDYLTDAEKITFDKIQHAFMITYYYLPYSAVSDSVTLWTIAHHTPLSAGFFQAWILQWLPFPSPGGPSQPRNQIHISCVSCLAGRFFTYWAIRKTHLR